MSERVPWTHSVFGEETLQHREAVRELTLNRVSLLGEQRVDPRLTGFVWTAAPARLESLVLADLTDVSWLDDRVAQPDSPVVPLLNLEWRERGVVVEGKQLFEQDEYMAHPVDVSWVWEEIFRPGLEQLAAGLERGEAVPELLSDGDGALDVEGLLRTSPCSAVSRCGSSPSPTWQACPRQTDGMGAQSSMM